MRRLADPGPECAPATEFAVCRTKAGWVSSFLMREHPELGRSGDVCPFTAQAFRLDTIRIGVCTATDIAGIKSAMRCCLQEFASIPCAHSMRNFRTVIVGFPNVNNADGLAALKKVQAQLKLYSFLHGLMIGRFHPESNNPGLWNRQFRPLRAPLPMLAVRHLVENDAPFALRHPLLLPSYLWRFSRTAPRRLLSAAGKR
jgi:hypothetical protein